MYLTFAEYTGYGGTLTQAAFNNYEPEAERIIDWYTFNRLTTEQDIPERVKQCMMKLISLLQMRDDLVSGLAATSSGSGSSSAAAIRSQSNDGVSISYNTIESSDLYNSLKLETKDNQFEMTIRFWLNGIKNSAGRNLLYRGIYPNE